MVIVHGRGKGGVGCKPTPVASASLTGARSLYRTTVWPSCHCCLSCTRVHRLTLAHDVSYKDNVKTCCQHVLHVASMGYGLYEESWVVNVGGLMQLVDCLLHAMVLALVGFVVCWSWLDGLASVTAPGCTCLLRLIAAPAVAGC